MTTEPGPPHEDLLITGDLLRRAQQGDEAALQGLMARYRPRLERWASGRLPSHARALLDTGDLVQETLMKTFVGLDQIEARGPGMFQAYVRKAILNRIRDELRRARIRKSAGASESELVVDNAPSPLELAIGADVLDRYERAMAQLSEDERQLLHFRVELGFTFEEIAVILERSTPDAVRMAAGRALSKLSRTMGHER